MMQNNIKVSIIAPIYGVEKYIKRFTKSVLSLDYDNIEFIFVNDCTKDNSIQVLSDVVKSNPNKADRVRIINHEVNKGLAGARLTGINNATGDYVWLVDSDDYINEKAIEEALPYMYNGDDLICSNFYRVTSDGIKEVYIERPTVKSIITSFSSPSVWKYFIKRSLITMNNIYPIQGINFSEDHLLMARLALKANRISYLNNSFFYYYDCTNMESYMRNINDKSLINYAQDGVIVFDFYSAQVSVKDYKEALVFMLLSRIWNLLSVKSQKDLVIQLLKRLKSVEKFYSTFVCTFIWSPRIVKALSSFYFKLFSKKILS